MGIKINKDSDVITKKLVELNFKMPLDVTIFFKEYNKDENNEDQNNNKEDNCDENNEILFEMKVHKIILDALPTQYFLELAKNNDDKFTLTIPKVNAEVLHAIFCRIYEIANNIFETNNLEKFFWKYYLQLYLVHRYFCFPNILFKELCVLFYGHDIYNANIKPKFYTLSKSIIVNEGIIYRKRTTHLSNREKLLQIGYWTNTYSETDDKLFLPYHLRISSENFDLLLYVIEIIGYDVHHIAIILANAPSDYTSKISSDLSNELLSFIKNRCGIAYYE